MAAPLTVKRNDYRKNKKNSTVYTPTGVAQFLFDILSPKFTAHLEPQCQVLSKYKSSYPGRPFTVFDPSIGSGRLTNPWYDIGCQIIGCDINDQGALCNTFDESTFESRQYTWNPDLVLCNPPFNGCQGKRLYSEVFLKKIFDLFGYQQPTVLFVPMGFRLNQRKKSKRWRWLRDCGAKITNIISLPLDIFEGVEFHVEIVIFNIDGLEPHYFLPEKYL